MCQFFSLCSKEGKPYYFDWELRKKCINGELKFEPDSHTSILSYYGFKGLAQDRFNKYEYNPLTKVFQIDQMNNEDDSLLIKDFCEKLNFKDIVPQLIIKPIIYPFKDRAITKVTKSDLLLLKKWASVWASVRDSVSDSVWASVRASVSDSVSDSVRDSVWASVRDSVSASVSDSVWASVRASVRDSVWASVRDSVWASVWAYYATFFDIKQKYNLISIQSLWEKGIVPSYDGKLWRLHGGKEGKILWEGKV